MLKIITAIVNTLLSLIVIAFITVVASYFIAIFAPDKVLHAIEMFKSLLQ